MQEIISAGKNDELEKKLGDNPSNVYFNTDTGASLLQYAVYCNNDRAVNIIKKYKPDLDVFEAACVGDNHRVDYLLIDNPDLLNAFSPDGFTLLGLASFFRHKSLVEYLLDNGSDPNIQSNNPAMVSPLHSACAVSDPEIASLLLKSGANVNARQMQGVTPLHSAAHNGRLDLSELLISQGADINAKTDDGQTPLAMALEKKFDETAEYLRSMGAGT